MQLLHRSELGMFLNSAGLLQTGAEVGVAGGRFSREILQTWQGSRLILVDCWQNQNPADYCDVANRDPTWHEGNYQQVVALARQDRRVEAVHGFTPAAAARFADESLDFVYLDANHSYLAVCEDLRAWYPKVKAGGLFAGHDYLDGYLGFGPDFQGGTLFGVKTAVDEFCQEMGQAASFTMLDAPHFSWFFRKQASQGPRRITVLTAYDAGLARLGDISRPNKERYCQRHEYTFCCRTGGFDRTRPPAWSKILFLLEALPHADWVFWTDADSLVMNGAVSLNWFLDDNCDLILPFDRINGLNTGCFFVRNTPWAKSFLELVYRQEQFTEHMWWENAAIMALYRSSAEVRQHVGVVPNKLFNAYITDGSYSPGDFMIHFPGLKDREVFLKNYAAMAR